MSDVAQALLEICISVRRCETHPGDVNVDDVAFYAHSLVSEVVCGRHEFTTHDALGVQFALELLHDELKLRRDPRAALAFPNSFLHIQETQP